MIVYHRTTDVAAGKMAEAIAFAHEISAAYKNATDQSLDVMTAIGGKPYQITWRGQCSGLAELDDAYAKMMADENYLQVLSKGTDLFIAGSVYDQIWRTM